MQFSRQAQSTGQRLLTEPHNPKFQGGICPAYAFMCCADALGLGSAYYCLDSTVLSSSNCGGTFTVYTVFSDPAELYGNSQDTVNITVAPGSGCVSTP